MKYCFIWFNFLIDSGYKVLVKLYCLCYYVRFYILCIVVHWRNCVIVLCFGVLASIIVSLCFFWKKRWIGTCSLLCVWCCDIYIKLIVFVLCDAINFGIMYKWLCEFCAMSYVCMFVWYYHVWSICRNIHFF